MYFVPFTDIDECAEGIDNCDPSSTDCVDVNGGYECQCKTGYMPSSPTLCTSKTFNKPEGILCIITIKYISVPLNYSTIGVLII